MRPNRNYLRYVARHKFFVLRAGLAIHSIVGDVGEIGYLRWLWRLLVHDRSKFGRAEWSPYVATFYGPVPSAAYGDARNAPGALGPEQVKRIMLNRKAAFNTAWLHHIHHNPHHWQHHILLEDSGKTIVLVPKASLVYEMVADWLAAGPKVNRAHSMQEAVAETIVWYANNHRQMQMREIARETAESVLLALSKHYGVSHIAETMDSVRRARESITILG